MIPFTTEKIKTSKKIPVTEIEAQDFSVPVSTPVYSGLLVLVVADDEFYHYGMVIVNCSERKSAYIHDFVTKKNAFYPLDQIRVLRFIPHVFFQPHIPGPNTADSIRSLAAQLPSYVNPFIQARIIPSITKILVIGDLHGHANALRHLLQTFYLKKFFDRDGFIDPHIIMVFTGDINDRGPRGPELWRIILSLKILNPQNIYILRGNHETLEMAQYGNFLGQMQECTQFSPELITYFLKDLYSKLPCGLFIGVAPQQRKDPYNSPYRFLFLCHGGIEPCVNLKYFLQKIVTQHKKTATESFEMNFRFDEQKLCGFLWTDFRPNRTAEEPALITDSTRGTNTYLYNAHAVMDFFDEHRSAYPAYPYILDSLVRGHQHIFGIGRAKTVSPEGEPDWDMLPNGIPEIMPPASVYTCIASTRWVYECINQVETYAEINFKEDPRSWEITAHINERFKY